MSGGRAWRLDTGLDPASTAVFICLRKGRGGHSEPQLVFIALRLKEGLSIFLERRGGKIFSSLTCDEGLLHFSICSPSGWSRRGSFSAGGSFRTVVYELIDMAGKAAGPMPASPLPHLQAQMRTHTAALMHTRYLRPVTRGEGSHALDERQWRSKRG